MFNHCSKILKRSWIITLLIWNLPLIAQDLSIAGLVVDGENNVPLPFSTIALMDANTGELVTGGLSEEDGYFSILGDLSDEYNIKITYIGYRDEQVALLVGDLNQNVDLGRIRLFPVL